MTAARIIARIEAAERKEINPHLRTDLRIAQLVVAWSADGVLGWCVYSQSPFAAAVRQILHCPPEEVWPRIIAERKSKLGAEYSDWFDAAGNLLPDLPLSEKKPPTREADFYHRLPSQEHIQEVLENAAA